MLTLKLTKKACVLLNKTSDFLSLRTSEVRILRLPLCSNILRLYFVFSFFYILGTVSLYAQPKYHPKANYWDELSKTIYTAVDNSKLTWKAQETQNGVLFFFQPNKNNQSLDLLTHIIFNERNSSEYVHLVREVAEDVKIALEQLDYFDDKNDKIIVVPLAIIDAGMSRSTSTVFHLNPEARSFLQFITEREEYDLQKIVRYQQWFRHGQLKVKQ